MPRRSDKTKNRDAVAKLLLSAFRRKCASRPGYSQSVLARDVGVSAAFITNIFSAKKSVPFERLKDISRCLELDVPERRRLLELLAQAALPAGSSFIKENSKQPVLRKRKIYEGPQNDLLSNWYTIAVLEGLCLEAPLQSLESLRKRLRISKTQIDGVFRFLREAKLIVEKDGAWVKAESHLYVPTGRSKKELRNYHEALLLKAREELVKKSEDTDFHRRLITGLTLSIHKDDVEAIKLKILQFFDSLPQTGSHESATDVYQCNLQFFPLTDPPDSAG
jgi:uncharacterized protein (TIGR02147 family)